jgi:hypothetical protein
MSSSGAQAGAPGQRLFGAERLAGHSARAGQSRDPPVAERGDG